MKQTFKQNISILLFACLVIVACSKVPFTGRSQVTGLFSTEDVLGMSYQSYQHVLDSVKLSDNEVEVARIQKVGEDIRMAAEELLAERGQSAVLEGFEWDFSRDGSRNVF